MLKTNNIGILHQSINGVNNPVLTLSGTKKDKDTTIHVFCDDQEMEIKCMNTEKENDFIITSRLNPNSKFLYVYIILPNGEKELVVQKRMSKIRRLLSKTKWNVKKIFT